MDMNTRLSEVQLKNELRLLTDIPAQTVADIVTLAESNPGQWVPAWGSSFSVRYADGKYQLAHRDELADAGQTTTWLP